MNKIFYFLILVSLWVSSCDIIKPDNNEVIIEGINHTDTTTEIFKVVNGKLETIGLQKRADGKFFFNLICEKENIISLGNKGYARVFVKPGDHLKVELRDNEYHVEADGDENTILSKWHESLQQIKDTSDNPYTTYKEFFPIVESWLQSEAYKGIDTEGMNTEFIKIFNSVKKIDTETTLMQFLLDGRFEHPDMKNLPSYYDEIIKDDKFPDASVFQYANGNKYLHCYLTYMFLKGKYDKNEDDLVQDMRHVKNDTLRSFLTMEYFSRLKNLSLKLAVDKYGKYLVTTDHIQKLKKQMKIQGLNQFGRQGLNFSYPNIDGVKTSLKDLKGKVVVIDVWATWCGPCKKEAPYFHELEKKYHGKDVAFVSISLDDNKEAWGKYMKRKKPEGMHLHASKAFSSDLAKEYGIVAIPRFLVFDKEGKVVSEDAPRPSESVLKDMIDSLL